MNMLSAVIAQPQAASASAAPAVLPVRVYSSADLPEALLAEWQDLAKTASEPNAFAEPWFVRAGLDNLPGIGADPRILAISDDLGLVGVIPLCVASRYGRLSVDHVENWRHHHDFLGIPLIRAGQEAMFWSALIRYLDAADWAPAFLHITGLVEGGAVHRGLVGAAWEMRRQCHCVHRSQRAFLDSPLGAEAYYEGAVRKKKRKELGRLAKRLGDLGKIRFERLAGGPDVARWTDDYLRLEASGWKGEGGTALASAVETEAFFRSVIAAAAEAKRLQMIRMTLDGAPIAMLVNFLSAPGSFSFKIAYDQAYARYSPGVLLEIENLKILDDPDIAWMDSCAVENHPMIDSLWRERRALLRCTVRLSGRKRGLIFHACRLLERGAATARLMVAGGMRR